MPRQLVLDTSYLDELFRVPGYFDEAAAQEIIDRCAAAIEQGDRLYVPVPVIYELGNHVATIHDGGRRIALATKLTDTIAQSLANTSPWIITPFSDAQTVIGYQKALSNAVTSFRDAFAASQIGLTDISVLDEARRLSTGPHGRSLGFVTHIWTRDAQLKAYEPDTERNAFV